MRAERLKTSIWVSALLRTAQSGGAYGLLSKTGDHDAGAVLVKVATLDGMASLFQSANDISGVRIWMNSGPMSEREIDEKIKKRLQSDPDLWVVEIEDRQGRHFLSEPVQNP